jgi:hypothetical protein
MELNSTFILGSFRSAQSNNWTSKLASESPRTSIMTRRAYREKFMAAWPAELAPPNDEYFLIGAGRRFRGCHPIVDTGALKLVNPGHIEFASLDARRQQYGVAGEFRTIADFHILVSACLCRSD